MKRALAGLLAAATLAGCTEGYPSDYEPVKKDGTRSQEFEADDIERANNAAPAVKDYCAGAVSEAQRIGCESHVEPDSPYINP